MPMQAELLNSVVKLINVIFGGLDHGSEGLYEFVATGVPAPDCFATSHPLQIKVPKSVSALES